MHSYLTFTYDGKTYSVVKPTQYSNMDEKTLVIICFYYYKFNRFDNNGNFKSKKILSRVETRNLRSILGINTEIFGNIYDRVLDNWYSIYHNVDKLFGSKEYSQVALISEINDGVLIEQENLFDDTIDFINRRKNGCKYSTVIVTKTILKDIYSFDFTDGYKLYIIFPCFVTNNDIEILKAYVNRFILNHSTDELFQYYHIADAYESDEKAVSHLLFKKEEFFKFMFETYKIYDICTPLTQTEVAQYISTNRNYSRIESIENYLNTITLFCMEHNCGIE